MHVWESHVVGLCDQRRWCADDSCVRRNFYEKLLNELTGCYNPVNGIVRTHEKIRNASDYNDITETQRRTCLQLVHLFVTSNAPFILCLTPKVWLECGFGRIHIDFILLINGRNGHEGQ